MRASEVRHRQILDSAIDYAIIAFDRDGKVTRWNEGAHRVLGWTEAEMLGQDGSRFFTPQDRAAGRMEEEMAQALRRGVGNDERWHLRKSGECFWAHGEMTPIRDADGEVGGFVKVLRDRTEQHLAAESLRRSEGRLRRAQEAGGVGTFTLDLASDMLDGTDAFYRLFGLPPDSGSLPARVLEALVLPEDAAVRSGAATRRTQMALLDVEYRIRRANDGAVRWIARKAEYECDAAGRALCMVGAVQDITARKAAQRALDTSAAQFLTFAQTLPNHVWTALPDGMLDWFNDRVYEYSGAARGTLDGQGWTRIVHPDDLPAAADLWAKALACEEPYETEFRLLGADGSHRWHLARAVPIRGPEGQISRWVGTNTDIHERKLAEARSTRDRERIWTLSQELMLICDYQGLIKAVNPSATRLLGWAEEDMVGERLDRFLHPDDRAGTVAEVAKLGHGATTLAFENRYRAKDGNYLLLDWTAVPDAGLIHAVARNITGERASAQERERIWNSTNDLMAIASAEGILQSVNPAWTRLLGHDAPALVGQAFISFVSADDQAEVARVIHRVAQGHWLNRFEIRLAHQDGRHSLVDWTSEHVGGVLYIVGRDVTEQRVAEDALRQAQKMEAVGQLTGGIAHDFNNLLQGITGNLSLAQKRIAQGRPQEIDRYLGSAMGCARRAAALTHRLLAFSRRQPLDPRPVEVNPLVHSMEDLLRRTLGERIELQILLAPALWRTQCDPNQLENAILNLTINARDAMPDGGRLVIETSNAVIDPFPAASQQDLQPGRYVCLCVTDTGSGMSADTVAKAFEPFFTTKAIGQGTGLGLSMIYGFARQSEGFAKIHSEVGHGTSVRLYLPQHRGKLVAEEPPSAVSEVPALGQASETVLVVEDEAVVRSLIVEVLGELGYQALEAVDGPSGLALLQSRRDICLLVTDIGLPGLNGRQMAEAGRQLHPGLKVLFMTGYAENAALAAGFLEPGMAMITKPFAMERLAAALRDMIESPLG
jgi:PAS domain S-box-containing protein